jgi:mono/diheme cytochrome c family protein
MLTHYLHMNICVYLCVLFLISLGEPLFFAPAPLRAQAGPSRSLQPPLPPQSAPAAPATPDVSELFRQICTKCHGADGTGSAARSCLPEIPDFTSAPWQARRADARLMASILDGKGSDMPPQGGKISEEQARGLVRASMSATAAFRNNRRSCDASFASCPRFPRAERDRSRRSQDSRGSPRSRLRRHWERPLLASFSGSAV